MKLTAKRTAGFSLIAISLFSIAETGREIALWSYGMNKYASDIADTLPIQFGGHVIDIVDDQPYRAPDTSDSRNGSLGRIQLTVDAKPYGRPSTAKVRLKLHGLGRYFGWVAASKFKESNVHDSSLWVSRRLEEKSAHSPLYEITRIDGNGSIATDTFATWRLGTDYRRLRVTQFMADDAIPLSVADALGLFPIFVLVFPIGTLVLGLVLARKQRGEVNHLAA